MQCDVAIIGGGLSGLTASIFAAEAGHAVTLIERSSKLGGRAGSVVRRGSVFNIGPHALYRRGAAMETFRQLGIHVGGGSPPLGGIVATEAGMQSMPSDPGRLLMSKLLTPAGKAAFGKLMLTLPRQRHWPEGMPWQAWLEARFPRDRGARQLLLALGRLWTYTDCPELIDAGALLRQAKIGLSGALYVHGGWQSIVDALRERAVAAGVTIVQAAADAIDQNNGAVAGVVLTNGERMETKAVIAAVPPAEVVRLLGPGQRALAEWHATATPAYASCLDVTLAEIPAPRRTLAVHLERPLYFSNHSAVARLSTSGHHVLHVLKYQRTAAAMEPVHDRRELEDWLDQLQPGWRKHVVTMRFLPQVTVAHDVPTVGRAPVGVADTGVAGAFVAGDWVGGVGMLADRAVASSRQAAARAISLLMQGEDHEQTDDRQGVKRRRAAV